MINKIILLTLALFIGSINANELFHPSQLKDISEAYQKPDAYGSFGFGMHSEIRALYLNRHTAKPSTPQFRHALKIIETTPMNALIIDMKNVKGDLTYRSNFSEAKRTRASRYATIRNIRSYVRNLKARGIYLIARIAVFKDKRQARTYPSRAVHTYGGRIWRDRHGEMWVDPFDPRARNYTLEIAEEVARLGFDEINFDYIRFPAHKGLRYDRADTRANRVAAIDSFLQEAKNRLHPLGVKVSVDIFGYVLWNRTDTHIGQILERMAPHVDYLCPMLYPSGFRRGSVTFSNPAAHPYDIVRISLRKGIARGVAPSKFRPWLQAFRDYAYSRHQYRERDIAAQIRAAEKLGASGWLLWNPSSRFTYVNERMFALIGYDRVEAPRAVRYTPRSARIKKRAHTASNHRKRSFKNKTAAPAKPSPLEILRRR
ncbi:putative glycoside hydrolase [Nitratifractor sp.]|uniref:putative glycoside hydrolase n=1 Tax=Nitratifractor sp. TaxID=2268144 RepID=UPI0025FCF475|nr:putative glycoside hydrolase [Nitratifractor sp.]